MVEYALARFIHSYCAVSLESRPMRDFRSTLCSMLLVWATVRVEAQALPTRVEDRRVRMQTAHGGVVDGRVVRVSADSVVVRDVKTQILTAVAQTDVLRAEMLTGIPRGRAAKRGALIGAGVGVAVIVAGLLADAKVDGEVMGYTNVALAAPVAVLITLIGTGIGAASGGEAWKPLAPGRIGATLHAGRTLAVGLRMSF